MQFQSKMASDASTSLPLNAGIAIGPILFVVAILAVLVGALAAGSGGFGSSTADDSNRINASTLVEQGTNIKTAVDRLMINGNAPADLYLSQLYTAATNSATALYSPSGGGLTPQSPPANVLATGAAWTYVPPAAGNLLGIGAANGDFITAIEVKSDTICKAINGIIFGKTSTIAATTPTMTTAPVLNTITTAQTDINLASTTPAIASNAFDNTGATGMEGRTQGCVKAGSTPKFYYFQLLTAG